jgi:hypothetical protein
MPDTFFTIRQRIHERSSHSYARGAEAQGLDDVCPTTDAAVDVDLATRVTDDFRVEFVDFEEGVECWWGAFGCVSGLNAMELRNVPVQSSTAMV